MTPVRLTQCLEAMHWTTETLADALGCDESLTEAWALGLAEIPAKAGAWIEVLAQAHMAAESGKPVSLKGERFAEDDL